MVNRQNTLRLIPAGTIVRDSRHRQSLARRETRVQALMN